MNTMPAPKRGPAPHDSQPKMRKMDEDGESLPSKTAPAKDSLKAEKEQEEAVSPRTKKKRSSSFDSGNKPAKPPKQSSPKNDPPAKKTKLLNTTSASCGEAPSQRANSKTSLKRTASTESDDELSSDGSKADFFRERDDEHKARCIRKYSNKVKAKRKADESSSDSQETSQSLPSGSLDPVQMDHDYGRFSNVSCLQSTGETDEKKESEDTFNEQERRKISNDATQKVSTDSSVSEIGSIGASIKFESAAEENKHMESKDLESQKVIDYETPSSREIVDSVISEVSVTSEVWEKAQEDKPESIEIHEDVHKETPTSSQKTPCSVAGEVNSSGEHTEEDTESAGRSESQAGLSGQNFSGKNELKKNCQTEEDEQGVTETAGVFTHQGDVNLDHALSSETNSVPEQVVIENNNPEGHIVENVTAVKSGFSETQEDLNVQVVFKKELNSTEHVPESVISLDDGVNKNVGMSEEKLEVSDKGVDSHSSQIAACPGALVQVQLSHGLVTADNCADAIADCKSVHGNNQMEMVSKSFIVPGDQAAPVVDVQFQENHCDNIEKIQTKTETDSTTDIQKDLNIQCASALNGQIRRDIEASNPDVTVELQSKDAHESTTELSKHFHKDHGGENFKMMEHKETLNSESCSRAESRHKMETTTLATSEICNAEPALKVQKHEIQEVSETSIVTSTENHDQFTVDISENMETQSRMEIHSVAELDLSNPPSKAEVQIQESQVSEPTTDVPDTGQKNPEITICKSSEDPECVSGTECLTNVNMHTTATSEEVCNMTQMVETCSQMNWVVSEPTSDTPDTGQKDLETSNCKSIEDGECIDAAESQIDMDLNAATSEDACNTTQIGEPHYQVNQVVSELTTKKPDEVQKVLQAADGESSEDVECVAPANNQIDVIIHTTPTSEEVCNMTQVAETHCQIIQVVCEPTTEIPHQTQKYQENTDCKSSEDAECVAPSASQIEADVQTEATPKEVCDTGPVIVMHNQMSSESTTEMSTDVYGDDKIENYNTAETVEYNNNTKLESVTVPQSQMEVTMHTVEVNKIPQYRANTLSELEMQIEKSQEVSAYITDGKLEEVHEDLMIENSQNVKNDDINSEIVTVQDDKIKTEIQITSTEISEAAPSMEIQSKEGQNEMNVQTSEQFSNVTTSEIQDQKSQDVKEQSTDVLSVTIAENHNKIENQPELRSEISSSLPPAEAQVQKNKEFSQTVRHASVNVQEGLRDPTNESNKNEKVLEGCVGTAERPNEVEMTVETAEEISAVASTVQTQSQIGQEVSEITDTEAENSSVCTESEQNNMGMQKSVPPLDRFDHISGTDFPNRGSQEVSKSTKNEDRAAFTYLPKSHINIEASAAPEETYYPAALAEQNHVVEEIKMDAMEAPDELQKLSLISNFENNKERAVPVEDVQRDVSAISGSIERADSALEKEEIGKQVIEVIGDRSHSNTQGAENNQLIGFVYGQPSDTDIVLQASELALKTVNQSDVEHHENVVVYEPISSPESNDNEEICQKMQLGEGVSLLEMQSTEPQHLQEDVSNFSANEHHNNIGDVKPEKDDDVKDDLFVSDGKAVVSADVQSISESHCSAHLDQSDATVDAKQVTTVRSSDDINMTDGWPKDTTEKRDRNSIPRYIPTPELSKQVQQAAGLQRDAGLQKDAGLHGDTGLQEGAGPKGDAGLQEVAGLQGDAGLQEVAGLQGDAGLQEVAGLQGDDGLQEVAGLQGDTGLQEDAGLHRDTGLQGDADTPVTISTPATTEVEMADGVSEEYVILEPVPDNEIHFDIVTQAAAASGLSASLSEEGRPDDMLVGEMTSQSILNGPQQFLETQTQPCDTTDLIKGVINSSVDDLSQKTKADIPQDGQSTDLQPSSTTVMKNTHPQDTNDSNAVVNESTGSHLNLQEVQILEDMEIGHEIVVAEEDNDEDGDITIIPKPQNQPVDGSSKKSEEKVFEKIKEDCSETVKQTNKVEKTEKEKKGQEVEKPKKQEMNTQARTKARLAALAEQKAAAAKRTANRQQLNLLALCQEIAEDIATDSMLLKRIEEEKQAAAAAAAATAAAAAAVAVAKAEASEKEHPPVHAQDSDSVNVTAPAEPKGCSAVATQSPEAPATQPVLADSAEVKPSPEPQKKRFFISQISVPLKVHEKKKLTRYQRLRQVELQREKMSWARMKKLKSDQTNQMFSDIDWQSPFSASPLFSMSPLTAAPPPTTSSSQISPTSPATSSKLSQPMAQAPKVEPAKAEPSKTETAKAGPSKAETPKTEPTKTGTSKSASVKAETAKTEPSVSENRRTTRQSKAQASKAAAAPGPAPKVTRSAAKRTLPAMPPPMPNGLNTQKTKPEIEYKPYRPRPKYSPDDFELDDDPLPVPPTKPSPPVRPARPSPLSNAATQCKPTAPLKPALSSQLANQAKLKAQTTPPRQISGQSKPSFAAQSHSTPAQSKFAVAASLQSKAAAASSSKPESSASVHSKPPVLTATQSKAISAPGQPRPAASASSLLKSASTAAQPAVSDKSETSSAVSKADVTSVPQKPPNPPSLEDAKYKNTAAPLSPTPTSSLSSVETSKVSEDAQQCEKKPAVTSGNSSTEMKTETVKTMQIASETPCQDRVEKPQDGATPLSDASVQKDVKKLKEADKDGTQTIIDAGQKHFGPVSCSVCGMLYSAANTEDEAQHLLFHNQFISAVKYVGWKKERILAEYPDGKIILVLPDDPKYALKKVEEIREMVDNDLGFQQVETKCPSKTKTFLFISIDKKVAGCLIAEHIQEGYRVIEEPLPEGSEREKVMFERQRAWCCSTTPEPAICGISRIWVVSMMRRQGIASRMLECLRNNFIYGSYLSKDEIAFSDPTPDGKLFATHYFGTSQFLVYNFVSGTRPSQPKTHAV